MKENIEPPAKYYAQNDFEKYLQSKDLSQSTIKRYSDETGKFILWCESENIEIENCTTTEVTGYLKHLQNKGQQSKTRNINLNIIKHFFHWQISAEQREDNPAGQIKIRGTKGKILYPLLSKQELESLHRSYQVPTEEHSQSKCNWFPNYKLARGRNKAILSLMIYQGLCTDEVNRLTLKDVRLREGNIFIASTRKSNERTLELKPQQIMELMEYSMEVRQALEALSCEKSQLYFLPTPSAGKKSSTNHDGINIWKRLSEEMRSSHKKFINFKQVRTSVITHWLKQYNLRQVQYMAGHRYVSSTEGYLINQVEDLQGDIDMFHPIG
jgi:site-specific recombinase XerD